MPKLTPARRRMLTIAAMSAIVALLIAKWDTAAFAEVLRRARPGALALAVASGFLAVVASVERWALMARAAGLPAPRGPLYRAFLEGRFLGVFTPSTVGLDVYRAGAHAHHGAALEAASAVVLVERLFGLLALGLFGAALVLFGPLALPGAFALPTFALVIVGAFLALAALASAPRLRPHLDRREGRLAGLARRVLEGAETARPAPRVALLAVTLGVVVHAATAALFAFSAAALGLGAGADPLALLTAGSAIVAATLVPLSVAGFGVREAAAVAALGALGAPTAIAVAASLLGFVALQPPALLGGLSLAARTRPDTLSAPAAPGPLVAAGSRTR